MSHAQRMDEIGRRLQRAVDADLQFAAGRARTGWRARLASRRARLLAGLAVAAAIAAPGAAWAAGAFTGPAQEAASLPATSGIFAGTDPTCTAVRPGAEYRCSLARAPKALPYLGLPDREMSELFSMSAVQEREFPTVADGTDADRYERFVAAVREWRADHAGPLLAAMGVPPATADAWVAAERDLSTATDVSVDHFAGHVEHTTDAAHRVNGACRAGDAAGTQWDCYLGPAAVAAGLIHSEVLGGQMPAGPSPDL